MPSTAKPDEMRIGDARSLNRNVARHWPNGGKLVTVHPMKKMNTLMLRAVREIHLRTAA